jgi:hypothetical protein
VYLPYPLICHQSEKDQQAQKSTKTQAKTIQGYLFKRNTGITKDWQRRYFVIEGGLMKYYKTNKVITIEFKLTLFKGFATYDCNQSSSMYSEAQGGHRQKILL